MPKRPCKIAGITPVVLAAKEGLALINGTQVSTALTLNGLFLAERLLEAASITGAMAVDAAKGSDAPFDPRIHAVRGQPGQIATASIYRELLKLAAKSVARIWSTMSACKIHTACAVSRKSWAPVSTSSIMRRALC